MASSIIHMAVASEINKKLKRNNDKLLIGSIAPDISKHLGLSKIESHFQDNDDSIPNIDKFLNKYKDRLNDDFVMGYFIHLYTDYLWFKYFIPEIYEKDMITKLDGTVVKCRGGMQKLYMYNDYTNLNTRLLDEYNMDLNIFYNEIPKIEEIIEEIPMDKLSIIVNATSIIIENTKVHKDYVFNINDVKKFIELCVKLTNAKIEETLETK